MIKFLIFIFLHFRVQLDLLTHLAKFQSITNIRSHFILTFISENLRPPLINLVPRLGCKWEKVTSKTQTYLTGWNYNNNQHRKLHKEQVQSFCCFSRDFQYLLLLQFQPVRYVWVFAGFHGTRNVDCFNSLLWLCFVWTAVEKTLRLRLISTCTDPVLALNFPLHLSVTRIKTASQLLHLQENTEVLASVNEQNMTGRLTGAEKYLAFRLLRSLSQFQV